MSRVQLSDAFTRYEAFSPKGTVYRVCQEPRPTTHRFFDTSPISPSGRYIALCRFPYDDRAITEGDACEIIVIDLTTAGERVVAKSIAWDGQLGAQVQWGASDDALFFNDMDEGEWVPYGVRMNPFTMERTRLASTVYMVAPDGKHAMSACLRRIGITQRGYGVIVPDAFIPKNHGAPDDDGVYEVDTTTGESRMVVSIKTIVESIKGGLSEEVLNESDFYLFHVKYSPDGKKVMLIFRFVPHDGGKTKGMVVTMDSDGKNIHLAVPHERYYKQEGNGHHPNWYPSSKRIVMNLLFDETDEHINFASFAPDGSDLRVMAKGILSSGHPSMHLSERFILADAYHFFDAHTHLVDDEGTTPIRLIDLETNEDIELVRIRTRPDEQGPNHLFRIDPHPVWDASYTRVTFNACPEGVREVCVLDVADFLKERGV